MLRLLYLAALYRWQGGNLSSLSEELTAESSDEDASTATTSAADDNASRGNRTPETGGAPTPAPASASQLQASPARGSTAAALGNAERGVGSNTPHARQDASSGDESEEKELKMLLKRMSIVSKLTALTVLTSIISDLDLIADWYFFREGLEGESTITTYVALAFTVVGTAMYVLLAVEFHLFNAVVILWCRKGEPLNPLQHVPLGGQLFLCVALEDIPQLIITCVTSPTSVAGALNIATAVFAVMAKIAEGYETRRDLPMSSQLRMVDEGPGIVRCMMVQRREAEELVGRAASLTVYVNRDRQISESASSRDEDRAAIAFKVMQVDPGFLNGKLNYMRRHLEVPKLDLDFYNLKGPIPPALGKFTALQELNLTVIHLNGSIPPELGELTALKTLDLGGNFLTDTIPEELGRLTVLQELSLWGNKLTGEIPPDLGGLTALVMLDLSSNSLSGEIPPDLGGLTALETLDLTKNSLSGEIPPDLGGLTALVMLNLSNNSLSGEIPPDLGGLTALVRLNLGRNSLIGEIPPDLGGLTALETLDLSKNSLSGEIPPDLGRLTALVTLDLSSNSLSGRIPTELRQLPALKNIHLEPNQLVEPWVV